MLASLRSWLADWLRPTPAPVVPAPSKRAAALPVRAAEPDADRGDPRLERRRREADERAREAEQRAGRAEKARKQAEGKLRALESDLSAARRRAEGAEARLKKTPDATSKKSGEARSKGDRSAEKQARAAEERLRLSEARRDQAEQGLAELERKLAAEVERGEATTRELAQAKAQRDAAEARQREPKVEDASPAKGAPLRRGVPRTFLDVHFSPGDECLVAICRQLDQAERTADVCVFTITDDRVSNRLLDAHRRGVRVRVITDNDKALDEGSDVHRLARAGIEVREDQTPFHMHHKFAVFDEQRMITGSYNWTRGAAQNNHENVVVSDDVRLIGPFSREFAALWAELGRG